MEMVLTMLIDEGKLKMAYRRGYLLGRGDELILTLIEAVLRAHAKEGSSIPNFYIEEWKASRAILKDISDEDWEILKRDYKYYLEDAADELKKAIEMDEFDYFDAGGNLTGLLTKIAKIIPSLWD